MSSAGHFCFLDEQVAVVTGGGQGIGEAICRRLAAAKARVAVFDRNESRAKAVAAECNGIAVAGDVTSEADIARCLAETEKKLGPISIVVNNAGITGRSLQTWELSDEDWHQVLAVDLTSVFLVCRAAVRLMRPRAGGRIVNIASIAGKEGNPTLVPYSTAKAGVIGLTKALAKEVARAGILVNAISPAVIETPILKQLTPEQVDYLVSRIPMGRTGKPEEVAALIAWLASDEASFTTGQCFDISGGRATY
jgi:NAD(P)-dependent dehydrogenase (short-subunit alcohol dehydrogenase family)